jgi:Holliday junction resolvase
MGKKFKITEEQLKRLVENKDKFKNDPTVKTEEETTEVQLNESVKTYKTDFDRYLKGPKQ